jgi:hypothetical protein
MIPKVREWLDARGFTLEMRTASAFRAAGFEVRQSSIYIDPKTGKAREIDVLAIDPDVLRIVDIRFIVECKSTKKPWVLLCSPDTLAGYHRVSAFASVSEQARFVLVDRLSGLLDKLPWLRKEGLIGYSVRQALSDAKVAYAAASTIAKACDNFVSGVDRYSAPLSFGFPVIVIDGPLIQCWLGENGHVQLEEVEQGEFLFFLGGLSHDFGICIRVVTVGLSLAKIQSTFEMNSPAERHVTLLRGRKDEVLRSFCVPQASTLGRSRKYSPNWRVHSQEYLAKVSLRVRSATSSVTEP